VHTFNLDGREFIRRAFESRRQQLSDNETEQTRHVFDHVVMNLPAIAIEFLDTFVGLFRGMTRVLMPIIHCYCFSSASDRDLDITRRIQAAMLGWPEDTALEIRRVRSVAPNKDMYCVSFRLPEQVARYEEGQESKRRRLNKEEE